MKKCITAASLLFVFLITCSFSSGAAAPASLLWRITGKGLSKPSYLFGTIHLICKEDYLWTDSMARCLAASDGLCLEANIGDPQVMNEMAMGMVSKDGRTLESYFSKEDYKRVQAYFKDSFQIDLAQLNAMKPFVLESLIARKAVACSEPLTYEQVLIGEMTAAKKPVAGLETAEEELAIADRIPADSIIASVLKMTTQSDDQSNSFHDIVAAYKRQDIGQLYRMTGELAALGNSGEAMLLSDRNKRWIGRMAPKMKGGSTFFAVGAGHLAGPEGLLALLRKAGYTVTAVQ